MKAIIVLTIVAFCFSIVSFLSRDGKKAKFPSIVGLIAAFAAMALAGVFSLKGELPRWLFWLSESNCLNIILSGTVFLESLTRKNKHE